MRLWDIRTGCAVAALATGYPLVAVGHLDPLLDDMAVDDLWAAFRRRY